MFVHSLLWHAGYKGALKPCPPFTRFHYFPPCATRSVTLRLVHFIPTVGFLSFYLLLHPLSYEELKIFFLLFGSFACSLFDLGNAVALWLHYIFILFCQRFLDCCSLVFPLFYLHIWCYTTSFVLDLEPFHRCSAVLE